MTDRDDSTRDTKIELPIGIRKYSCQLDIGRHWLPLQERAAQRLFDAADFHAGGQEFGNVEDAIGARGPVRPGIEFRIIFPEFESALGF